MKEAHFELGKWGEEYAARWLVRQGATVLARNWRCGAGELDIIAEQDGLVLACEVKTRRDLGHGHPSEAVDAQRLARLRQAAEQWWALHQATSIRIDVLTILVSANHIEVEQLAGVAG